MSLVSGVVPNSAKFQQGGLPVSMDSRRRTISISPQTGTGVYSPTGNNVIRIPLTSSIGFLDCSTSYLRFRVRNKNESIDLAKPCRMDQNCMSWVSKLEILSNTGSSIETIQDYNLLVNLLHKATSPDDYRSSVGRFIDNQGDECERQAAMIRGSGKVYCSGFDGSGILNGSSNRLLPLQFLQGPMVIELTLAPFNDCFVGVGASGKTPEYELDNVEFICDAISMGQDYLAVFGEQLATNGIDMSFSSYRSHHTSLHAGQQTIQISQNSKSCKGVYTIIRGKDTYHSNYVDSLSTYKSGNLIDYQYNLGSKLYPEFKVNTSSSGGSVNTLYCQNLNSWNQFRDHSGGNSIRPEHFMADQTGATPARGLTEGTYHSEPIKRVFGWFNGADATNYIKGAHSDNSYAVTLTFTPADPMHWGDIPLGAKLKMGLTDKNDTDTAYDEGTGTPGTVDLARDTTDGEVTSNHAGLDRFLDEAAAGVIKPGTKGVALLRSHILTEPAQTATGNITKFYGNDGYYIMYAGTPCTYRNGNGPGYSGVGIPLVDGQGNLIHTKTQALVNVAGYLDVLASDEDFYIGQTFETFDQHGSLISGSDLTRTTPLHLTLNFKDAVDSNKHINQPLEAGDLATSFVQYDAIMKILPDGLVISSQ